MKLYKTLYIWNSMKQSLQRLDPFSQNFSQNSMKEIELYCSSARPNLHRQLYETQLYETPQLYERSINSVKDTKTLRNMSIKLRGPQFEL